MMPLDPPADYDAGTCVDCGDVATQGAVCSDCGAERNEKLAAADRASERAETVAHGLDCALRRYRLDGDARCLAATVEEAIEWLRKKEAA